MIMFHKNEKSSEITINSDISKDFNMELMIGLEPTTYALPRHIVAPVFRHLSDFLTGI